MQRLIPPKYRFVSGSVLKLTAVVTMLIDHIALYFLRTSQIVLIPFEENPFTLYFLMRSIGRVAFPLYAFLLAEGFVHTKNRLKYGISLAVLALVSELPWNLVHTGTLFYHSQNVMFTLLTGYLALCAAERFKNKAPLLVLCLAALTAAAFTLDFDYGSQGYCLILIMYYLREYAAVRAVAGICILPSRWVGGFAFLPIAFYNGKRGFIKSMALKYAFYAFYPVHLFVIYLLHYHVIK